MRQAQTAFAPVGETSLTGGDPDKVRTGVLAQSGCWGRVTRRGGQCQAGLRPAAPAHLGGKSGLSRR